MSGTNVRVLETLEAAVDMSAKQFTIVKSAVIAGKAGCTTSTAATDEHLGVMLDKPGLNEVGGVAMCSQGGFCPVIYGGTVTAGDKLTSDASGRAITSVTATHKTIGVARVSGVINQIGEVLLGSGPDVI